MFHMFSEKTKNNQLMSANLENAEYHSHCIVFQWVFIYFKELANLAIFYDTLCNKLFYFGGKFEFILD